MRSDVCSLSCRCRTGWLVVNAGVGKWLQGISSNRRQGPSVCAVAYRTGRLRDRRATAVSCVSDSSAPRRTWARCVSLQELISPMTMRGNEAGHKGESDGQTTFARHGRHEAVPIKCQPATPAFRSAQKMTSILGPVIVVTAVVEPGRHYHSRLGASFVNAAAVVGRLAQEVAA